MNDDDLEPLGEEFEAVWDANRDILYRDDDYEYCWLCGLGRAVYSSGVCLDCAEKYPAPPPPPSEVEILRAKVLAMQDAIEWLLFYAEQDEEFAAPDWLLALVPDHNKTHRE